MNNHFLFSHNSIARNFSILFQYFIQRELLQYLFFLPDKIGTCQIKLNSKERVNFIRVRNKVL